MATLSTHQNEAHLRRALQGCRFSHVRWVAETGSTNDDLLATVDEPPLERVLVTDLQTAGRGRRDRVWQAPAGSSLLLSVRLSRSSIDPFWVVGALGIATVDALKRTVGVEAALKWPNDVLIKGRKVAGVLTQAVDEVLVVGMGLNVNWPAPLPDGLAATATSVNHHLSSGLTGRGVIDRAYLATAVLVHFDRLLAFDAPELRRLWKQRCVTIGAAVRLETDGADAPIEGIAVDVAVTGELLVDTGHDVVAHAVGDVIHLRPLQ